MIAPPNPIEQERELIAKILDPAVADNPLVFVRTAFRWGDPETFLANHKEPRKWQCEELERLGDFVRMQLQAKARGANPRMYRRAYCSGHGTGKGAFWAMCRHWMKSTRLGSTVLDTANTDDQLKTRTWAESEKWFGASVNKHWFDFKLNALTCEPAPWFRDELSHSGIPLGLYRDFGQMYKPGKSDSFAGVHNDRGVMFGIDEASGVPDFISTTAQGFFTDETLWRFWFQFSQGRHLEGYFHDIFEEDSEWETRHINALEVEGTDKEYLQGIVDKQGPSSYDARVLVFGLFADQVEDQFIKNSLVDCAMNREWTPEHERAAKHIPIIWAVDPSGGGPDLAVIGKRRGFDMRSIPMVTFSGLKPEYLVKAIVAEYRNTPADLKPEEIVFDETGVGLGIKEWVRSILRKRVRVTGINFGSESVSRAWADKRTELYARARAWLDTGFLPKCKELKRDLIAPKSERLDGGKVKLESKRKLRKKGLPSPDRGDVVALSMEPEIVPFDPDRNRDRPKRSNDSEYHRDPLHRRAA